MSDIRLIAGLGNPGKRYENTRHNVGFMAVDLLIQKLGLDLNQKKFSSVFAQTQYKDKKLILLQPQEYMNRSGLAIATVKGFYKIQDAEMLVLTDDLALEPGVIRIKPQGSAGGHNGLKDIIEKIGTNQFPRLRIGIGQSTFADSKDYVLGRISPEQADDIKNAIERAVEAIFCWLDEDIDSVMNRFNVKNNQEN